MKNRKKIALLAIMTAMTTCILSSCGAGVNATTSPDGSSHLPKGTEADTGKSVTLTYAIFDTYQSNEFELQNMQAKLHETFPNINVEVEKAKDSAELEKTMKIRAASNQLPDLMAAKPYMLDPFKNHLVDLSNMEIVSKCPSATAYAIDGKVYGIPDRQLREFVFYWADIFEKHNIKVPETWDEFVGAAEAIKAADPNMIPITLGAKDEWTNFPFTEYMPPLENGGNGMIWSTMASQDHPFSLEQPFATAFMKIKKLFDAKVFGSDPIGIGYDQSKTLFINKQASMFVISAWGLNAIRDAGVDTTQLKTFLLPTRNSTNDPFLTISQADNFMTITSNCKNPEQAKEFMTWYYEDWYPNLIAKVDALSTFPDVEKSLDPILQIAIDARPDAQVIMYNGGNENYNKIVTETNFDYKKLGVEMLTPGFDLQKRLNELNVAWAEARKNLQIG